MASISGITLTGGNYDPNTAFGGIQPKGTALLAGASSANAFSPSFSNSYSQPNPAFSAPGSSSLTVPGLTTTRPTSPLTNTSVPEFASATHTVTTPTPTTLPNGGTASSYGNTVTGPTSYNIDTSGAVPSSALSTDYTQNDLTGARNQYAQYVQGLSQANQYSPDYIAAFQKSQNLGAAEAQLRGNLATGNVGGDTQGYAEGFTNRQLMGADAQKSFADISLQAQALIRQGDIAGANALVEGYKPVSVSPGSSLVTPTDGSQVYSGLGGYQAVQGIQTVNNLAQTYPDANIQPGDSLQTAQQKASQAPSFASRQLVQVTLPGGGIEFVNKNQMQTNPDGSFTVVGSGQAASQNAAAATLKDLQTQRANIASAITTADKNFPLLIQAADNAGLNDNIPVLNYFNQRLATATGKEEVAVLNTLVPSLQAEYARILARGGGATTVDERKTSQALIDGTYTLGQLKAVYKTVKQESGNVLAGYDSQIQAQLSTLNGGGSTAPSGSGVFSF